jgi:hypothetical protein
MLSYFFLENFTTHSKRTHFLWNTYAKTWALIWAAMVSSALGQQ